MIDCARYNFCKTNYMYVSARQLQRNDVLLPHLMYMESQGSLPWLGVYSYIYTIEHIISWTDGLPIICFRFCTVKYTILVYYRTKCHTFFWNYSFLNIYFIYYIYLSLQEIFLIFQSSFRAFQILFELPRDK